MDLLLTTCVLGSVLACLTAVMAGALLARWLA